MKRLLVASNLTKSASNALAQAIRLAALTGAAIRIVHAAERSQSPDETLAIRKRILTEARLMADEMIGRALDLSVTISHHRPGEAIVRKAASFDADLILLGAHGEPRFRDAVFGTTAGHVVRHSDRPVLVVQGSDALPYAKVLVALDDPGSAGPVLDRALAIAPAAELFAVHVFDSPPSPLWGSGERCRGQELSKEAEIEAFLRESLPGRDGTMSSTKHAIVETGDVSTIMMAECFLVAPDLVAMGRHSRSPFVASHAIDTLSWCRSDILIVPDPSDAPSVASPVAVSPAR